MKVIILAGGKGTRLNLKDIPKPMAKVGDSSILERQIKEAKKYGLNDFFFLTGHLSDVIFNNFKDGSDYSIKISHIIEPYPLGTAGAVKMLENIITEDFLVFYGDTIFDIDLSQFIKFHQERKSLATLVAHPNDHPFDSDLIVTEQDELTISSFLKRPYKDELLYKNLVNAGMYILSPEIFKYIPFGKKCDFGIDVFPSIIKHKGKIQVYKTTEYIKDVGTPARIKEVEKSLENGKITALNKKNMQKAIFLDRDGVINKFIDNLSNIDQFILEDQVAEGIRKINKSDFLTIVVTNQPMIAKGFMDYNDLNEIHKKMETLLGKHRSYIDGIYFCPHHPDSGFEGEIKELKVNCQCRKPSPGMLLQAAKDFNIDLSKSWIIGDHERDILCGKSENVTPIYVGKQNSFCSENKIVNKKNLFEAVNYILDIK